jgi:hypothetical protein
MEVARAFPKASSLSRSARSLSRSRILNVGLPIGDVVKVSAPRCPASTEVDVGKPDSERRAAKDSRGRGLGDASTEVVLVPLGCAVVTLLLLVRPLI